MKFLSCEKISEHKYKTPEGYLICIDSILARTGKQTYKRREVFGVDCADAENEVDVDRTPEEVFSDKTLASFENKPLTMEHPDEDVNIENHNTLSVGFARDIKRGKTDKGEDVMLGTLVFTDADAIEAIENGDMTDLSCGYDCDIVDEANPCQRNIRGNHIALCQQGRAGIARIVDSVKDMAKLSADESATLKAMIEGGAGKSLYNRLSFDKPTTIHLSQEDKELLRWHRDENQYLTDKEKTLLKKLVGDSVKDSFRTEFETFLKSKVEFKGPHIGPKYYIYTMARPYYTIIGEIRTWLSNKNVNFKIDKFPDDVDILIDKQSMQDSTNDSYYTESDKKDKQFVKEALSEMRRYVNNWSFMSAKEKRNIGSLSELKARIKELEQVQDSAKDAGRSAEKMAKLEIEKLKSEIFQKEKELESYMKYDYRFGSARSSDRIQDNLKRQISKLKQKLAKLKQEWSYCLDSLREPTSAELKKFEDYLIQRHWHVKKLGVTWTGRIHYEVSKLLKPGDSDRLLINEIEAAEDYSGLDMTYSIGSTGKELKGVVDIDKVYVKDSDTYKEVTKNLKEQAKKEMKDDFKEGQSVKYKGFTAKILRKLSEDEKKRLAYKLNPDAGDYYEIEYGDRFKFNEIVWANRLSDSISDDASEDWTRAIWNENLKFEFINGGYGMKFKSQKDYDRAKELAKKYRMTKGHWYDKDLEYFDYSSTQIGNEDSIKDSLKQFKVKYKDSKGRQVIHFVKAKSLVDAIKQVEDDRLAPMTYKKLKELGVSKETYSKWTQEQANRYISAKSRVEKAKSKVEEKSKSSKKTSMASHLSEANDKIKEALDNDNDHVELELPKNIDHDKFFSKLDDLAQDKEFSYDIEEKSKYDGGTYYYISIKSTSDDNDDSNELASSLSMQIDEAYDEDELDEAEYAINSAYDDGDLTEEHYNSLLEELNAKREELE